jgi:hypothetical protein
MVSASLNAIGSREIRLFGPEPGAAGVRVIEQTGSGDLQTPTQAPIVVIGEFKRGPVDVPIFLASRDQYDEIFGDKRDRRWAIYVNGEFSSPDVIEGYYAMAGKNAPLWIIRIGRENKGKKAKFALKNPMGTPVIEFLAANFGRWAGAKQELPQATLIVVTSRTFTIHAPGIESNEFIGGKAYFSEQLGQPFDIVANTAAFETGEAIFTVAPQFDLLASGINGPVTLTGTASYNLTVPIVGSVASPMYIDLAGTITVNGRVLNGTGTTFTTDLALGQNIYYQGEARTVESISSDTTVTINAPFTNDGTGVVLQLDNLIVTGTGTTFGTNLVGHRLYVTIGGNRYERTIARVNSVTELELASGFPVEVPAGTAARIDNFWVQGTGANFATEVQTGNAIIDPSRRGESVIVAEVDAVGNRFRVQQQFSSGFNDAQLTKQSQGVTIKLESPKGQGLAVEAGLGRRFPLSHFSLNFYFNGSLVHRVPDASLDPQDPLFVETLINDGNIAYRSGQDTFQTYVTARSLWTSVYTTAKTNDVRPFNAAGTMLLVTPRRIYTVADFDYNGVAGALMHTSPYNQPGEIVRVMSGVAPVTLEGTFSTTGVSVNGVGSNFTRIFKRNDYLYDPTSNTVRKVRLVTSDSQMTLETAFPSNVPALTQGKKAGYLQLNEGIDLTTSSQEGDKFVVVFAEFFEGGFDGDTAVIRPYYYTKHLNPDSNIIERSLWGTGAGMWRMCCPDTTMPDVQKMGALYGSRTASEFRCLIPPEYTPAMAEIFIKEDVGMSEFITVAYPSYGYVTDPIRGGQRMIPIIGDIMGLETLFARQNNGWHVPAAGTEAKLSRINELIYRVSPGEEARLNQAGIQPIKKMFGNAVIFGAECPALDELYKFIHVRRSQSQMARELREAMPFMRRLFKPNQPMAAEQLRMVLLSYAREMYRRGVFNQYLMFEQAAQITIESPLTQSANAIDEFDRDRIAALANGDLTARMDWYPAGILKNLYIRLSPDVVTANYTS